MNVDFKKIIAWLERNKIGYSIKDNKIVLFNDASGSVELVFNYDKSTPKAPRGYLMPTHAAENSDFYVKIGDWGKWINEFISWAKERSYHECNNYHCAQWGTWKFDNFISFSFLKVFLKKAIKMHNSIQMGESMRLEEALDILNENDYLVESHVQGHCANCGEELWSDEAWNEYKGKRYCDSCYEEIARPKGKFREAEIYFKDLDTKQTNNVGIEIRDCPAKTKKAAKEYALKKFQEKIYDGFYDRVNMLMHTRERRFRNIKIMKVELY